MSEKYRKGLADGKRAGASQSVFAPDGEDVEYIAGYSAGYASEFDEERNLAEEQRRGREDAEQTANAKAREETRHISPIGRIVWGKQWPDKAKEISSLTHGEIGALGRSYLYQPEKHVDKRRLAAVERELYDLDDPERIFIVAVLDALVEAIALPRHAGDFVSALTRQKTGLARPDWGRCTLADLRTIAFTLPMGPESYEGMDWKWIHKDYRKRASLFFGRGTFV